MNRSPIIVDARVGRESTLVAGFRQGFPLEASLEMVFLGEKHRVIA